MVLDEASNPSPDTPYTPESTASSDIDSYSSDSANVQTLDIDLRRFPSPPPISGPLLGYTQRRRSDLVHRGLAAQSQLLKRPPTQEEAEALAYNLCYSDTVIFWGSAIGLVVGLALARRGRQTFRFPFITPNPQNFNANQFGPLRGDRAQMAWHIVRGTIYGSSGYAIGSIASSSWSAIHFASALRQDPRLQEMRIAMEEFSRARAGATSRQQRPMPQPQAAGRQPKQEGWDDDMSPRAGGYSESDPGTLLDAETRGQESQQRSVPGWDTTGSRQPLSENRQRPSPAGGYARPDDDASPVAGAQSESSWERIRREAASGGSPRPGGSGSSRRAPWEHRGGSTQGDGYTFSDSEEDRQLAKAEAQKEFDARVERERQGKDFDESGRRW